MPFLAPCACGAHVIDVLRVQTAIFHPTDAAQGVYSLALASGEQATVNGVQLSTNERRELHDLDEIVVTRGNQRTRGVVFFFGPLEPLFIPTRIPVLDEARAQQFPVEQVEQQWKIITEAIKRRIPENPALQKAMLSFETALVSESVPLTLLQAAAKADQLIAQLVKRYESVLVSYLSLPAVPDDVIIPDVRNSATYNDLRKAREDTPFYEIVIEAASDNTVIQSYIDEHGTLLLTDYLADRSKIRDIPPDVIDALNGAVEKYTLQLSGECMEGYSI